MRRWVPRLAAAVVGSGLLGCTRQGPNAAPAADAITRALGAHQLACPGFAEHLRRVEAMSIPEMAKVGLADTLPPRGATSLERVNAVLPLARRDYPHAVSVAAGPGLGVTYTQGPDSVIGYHRSPDYQVWVVVARAPDCPATAAFVLGADAAGDRVPVFFAYQRS